ncbi:MULTISPECIES: siroheme decarboxylase subunit alpha [Desulfococcus]|uniref:siroheme decarboxylase n=1 Tax=Desulfococcus multivorans DSM 2059 TaxID=1121405 RepID=S7UU19_DESML|nr:AsnC family transcriptional regulator [Desulfococcus multivorans]EPR35833.1 putative transcriptional regulator, AsnC family [Desulfococcus multivorans DSM 2059]SJZ33890.1 transcriptional regulator, AsnC family [Desulfococcus multivorans DSM 2059]
MDESATPPAVRQTGNDGMNGSANRSIPGAEANLPNTPVSDAAPIDEMDATDRRLLNRIQSDFPISPNPYADIGAELGIPEAEVIRRLRRLKACGIIRRIGANFFPRKLGFVSTLCAAKVPEDRHALFAETVNRYPGVTHNYTRDGDFNVWFTFIAPSMSEIERHLREIVDVTGVKEIINLPATAVYKIKAHFDL